MAFDIVFTENKIVLNYEPDLERNDETKTLLESGDKKRISRSFHVSKLHWLDPEEYDPTYIYHFEIGVLDFKKIGKYYKIHKEIFNLKNGVFFSEELRNEDLFMTNWFEKSKISILGSLDRFFKEDIYIGYSENDNLNFGIFKQILKAIPQSFEINKYKRSRVSSILRQYFHENEDTVENYNSYINKKVIKKSEVFIHPKYSQYEKQKFQDILLELKEMLKDESQYTERAWQERILQILTLIFPKYIDVQREIRFTDINGVKRSLDFGLIDFNGNLDLVEIKKPDGYTIFLKSKRRDNYVPSSEVSASIMQIEKYIFSLNKLSRNSSNEIGKRHFNGAEFEITNPKGILILGRSNEFDKEQKLDFEILKRKYSNIVDIITYDDLIERLNRIVERFNKDI